MRAGEVSESDDWHEGYESGCTSMDDEWLEALEPFLPKHVVRTPLGVADYLHGLRVARSE